ncbi:hypothetical protein ABZ799_26710 [Nocardiopsis dassonvillei]|uniref:hypothetical protein n=1 Tax=Nocardiopsis dassonvillei TaxID=2014 RepID=UPI0033C3ED18
MKNIFKRAAAVVAATGVVMAGSVATAAPASAALTWIDDDQVLSISNSRTAVSKDTSVGTVQVRFGTYQGRQYGWGRVLNGRTGYVLFFEVDTNGDRVMDEGATAYIPDGNPRWTWGAPTSSSSARAFRACILNSSQFSCSETSNRTAWW